MRIAYFFASVYKDVNVFEKCSIMSFSGGSEKWCDPFYGMNIETLLVLDSSAHEMTVHNSAIFYLEAW